MIRGFDCVLQVLVLGLSICALAVGEDKCVSSWMPPHVCPVANSFFGFHFVVLSVVPFCIIVSKSEVASSSFWPKQLAQGSTLLLTQIGILLFILTVGKLTIVSSSAPHLRAKGKEKCPIIFISNYFIKR